jgi:protein phosphatase
MLTAYGVSHVGLVRKTNEDAFLWDTDLGLFCVADGMGGHNAGEVASQLAVESIRDFVRRTHGHNDFTWPFGFDSRFSFDANRLVTAVKLANLEVFSTSEDRDEYSGMGTTVVAALVRGSHLTFIGVGDSRIYSLKDGQLTQLTHDDSWIATVLDHANGVTEASLASHPLRHVLTNVVGAGEEVAVEVAERELELNEVLLFSSDGLHGLVPDGTICDVLRANSSLETAACRLVQEALEQGGSDNATALLVRRDS